jgi:hypothetical protein
MYRHFFDWSDKWVDEKIIELKNYEIQVTDTEKSDQDYESIIAGIQTKIKEYNNINKNKIKDVDLYSSIDEFWLDISPVYILK